MRIIYFDICALPLFLIILSICYSRRMTKGLANRLFIGLVTLSLISAIADLSMETADNLVPLSEAGRIICTISTYLYLAARNATNAILLLFLIALTRTNFLISKTWVKIVFCLPYLVILLLLAQNPFTHSAFTVTAETGYVRGPLILAFYGIALLYGIIGLFYCIYCRRYLSKNKWASLLSIYLLEHIAVLIQFLYPNLLLEMFCTAVGEMLIMLSIIRPEERMDSEVGMLSWTSYQSDLKNILRTGERVQIVVIQMTNSLELRRYLGDHRYNALLFEISNGIRAWQHGRSSGTELYFERPGTICLITGENEAFSENDIERLLSETGPMNRHFADMEVRFEPKICLISVPDDLRNEEEILSLGHIFHKMGGRSQDISRAADLVHSQSFAIEAHIGEILERAISQKHIEMYYQPICDVRSGNFHSAEALARIIDPVYGLISPAVFIPAAETQGLMIPFGDAVLDQVFRFVSEHDPDSIGLSYIEINLSVAQCMEISLPDKIRALQQKYGVDPRHINLEITETNFESISEVMMQNVSELVHMGYSFALDDYGIGYSSIQRINRLPLQLIKIDKSMLDEVSSENGRTILEHSIHMMQSIGKQVVVEGAETHEAVEILRGMGCDYIQGFYFSRPLPKDDFIRFMGSRLQ